MPEWALLDTFERHMVFVRFSSSWGVRQIEAECSPKGSAGCSKMAVPPAIKTATVRIKEVKRSSEATNNWSKALGLSPSPPPNRAEPKSGGC